MPSFLNMFRRYFPTWSEVRSKPTAFNPAAHKTSHQHDGSDEMNVTSLAGTTPRAILGDATAGRVSRTIKIWIQNGTNANTIKVKGVNIWNSNDIAEEDNLGKTGDTGNFALNINGKELTVQASGFTGSAIAVTAATMKSNRSNSYRTIATEISGGDIVISLYDLGTALAEDLTSLVDEGLVIIQLEYKTDS